MSSSALSSVVTHTVVLPEVALPQQNSGYQPVVSLGVVPALTPYLGAVPESVPPFDTEVPAPRPRSLAAAPTITQRRTSSRPNASMVGSASLGLVRGTAGPSDVRDPDVPGWSRDADTGITLTAAQELPPSRVASHMLARAVIEVISGYRQLAQLRIHCAPEVFAGIGQHIRVGGPPSKLTSVRVSEPADGVVEASAVFRRRHRSAAMAFRLQGVDGRWRITALQIG